jgi:hypothetical protein
MTMLCVVLLLLLLSPSLSPPPLSLFLSLRYCISRYSYICAAVIQTGRKFNECACAQHRAHRLSYNTVTLSCIYIYCIQMSCAINSRKPRKTLQNGGDPREMQNGVKEAPRLLPLCKIAPKVYTYGLYQSVCDRHQSPDRPTCP